jgi:hypothetical protein
LTTSGGAESANLPIIDRSGPFKVIIYPDDHDPAHVHVNHSSGCVAIFNVGTADEPELRELRGKMKYSDVRRAVKLVLQNHAEYLERWQQIHGGRHE